MTSTFCLQQFNSTLSITGFCCSSFTWCLFWHCNSPILHTDRAHPAPDVLTPFSSHTCALLFSAVCPLATQALLQLNSPLQISGILINWKVVFQQMCREQHNGQDPELQFSSAPHPVMTFSVWLWVRFSFLCASVYQLCNADSYTPVLELRNSQARLKKLNNAR